VRVSGILTLGDEHGDLVCKAPGPRLGESGDECTHVWFDWTALGGSEAAVRRVISQWNGSFGYVEGLKTEYPDRLLAASYVQTARPAAESYCLGYTGPALASPAEKAFGPTLFSPDRCVAGFFSRSKPGWPDCVDMAEPIVWVTEVVGTEQTVFFGQVLKARLVARPFVPPAPYETRDVSEFLALSESVFLFTLPTGGLYAWDGTHSELIQRPSVDYLRNGAIGSIYYRIRTFEENGALGSNAVARIDASLRSEVLWESTELRLERLHYEAGVLEIEVYDGSSSEVLTLTQEEVSPVDVQGQEPDPLVIVEWPKPSPS